MSSFENVLAMDNSVAVHQRRQLQLIVIEIYKAKHIVDPSLMREICEEEVLPYNLSCSDRLQLPKVKKLPWKRYS